MLQGQLGSETSRTARMGICLAAWLALARQAAAADAPVTFETQAGRVVISVDGRPLGTYVFDDPEIKRPYFAGLRAPDGTPVTRHHPPREGIDATDHAAMHPGLWIGFGDISGHDFWRNKGTVKHVEFSRPPAADGQGAEFAVRNRYLAGDRAVCDELCTMVIRLRPAGWWIDWTSEFTGADEFEFGDQEEMGLGVRLATPLSVTKGGTISNSEGGRNEAQVWGKQSDWCDYSGTAEGRPAGILLVPDAANFRRSWFHARDYGVLVANPFGRNAFTKGDKSRVVVKPGETLRLRFGILLHSGETDLDAAARDWRQISPR